MCVKFPLVFYGLQTLQLCCEYTIKVAEERAWLKQPEQTCERLL